MCVYHNFFFKETIMLQFKLYHLTRDHIYPLSVIADQKRRGKVRFFVSVRVCVSFSGCAYIHGKLHKAT